MSTLFTQYSTIRHNPRDALEAIGGSAMASTSSAGGYDQGYEACPCFWGEQPGSMVDLLTSHLDVRGLHILDAGCGEGKNSVHLARRGAIVTAIDVSASAIANALRYWPTQNRVTWHQADITKFELGGNQFDVVLAYGLLHCLPDADTIIRTVRKLQKATKHGGFNVLVAFNQRFQDLRAHPGFAPCLVAHADYLRAYSSWSIIHASDKDLQEVHPHNQIPHTHALTRILARRWNW